eukprot:gene6158-6865_t
MATKLQQWIFGLSIFSAVYFSIILEFVQLKLSSNARLLVQISPVIIVAAFGVRTILFKNYMVMVVLFFSVQLTNNAALRFKIPMPLHMIFRSGSLMANLVLGVLILKRSYAKSKYIGVIMITFGIILCTLVTVTGEEMKSGDSFLDIFWWAVGVFLLVTALFLSARLGIMQEQIALEFGKHPDESLFYSHALPMPCFIFLSSDIYKHAILFSNSELFMIPVVNQQVPIMWLYLIGNTANASSCFDENNQQKATKKMNTLSITVFVAAIALAQAKPATLRARAIIEPNIKQEFGYRVHGSIDIRQAVGGMTLFAIDLQGFIPNTTHGFHVHQNGDIYTKGCSSTGGHYNPFGTKHGSPNAKVRHVGDLGNVRADQNGRVKLVRVDKLAKLDGANSIAGRAFVVHAGVDDLGLGVGKARKGSLKTGNAGGRVACGIIYYK